MTALPPAAKRYGRGAPPLGAGLGCRCPRCGEGRLYAALALIRPLKAVFIALQYRNRASDSGTRDYEA